MAIKAIEQPYYRVGSCGDGCCSWGEYRKVWLALDRLTVLDATEYSEYPGEHEARPEIEVVEVLPVIEEFVD